MSPAASPRPYVSDFSAKCSEKLILFHEKVFGGLHISAFLKDLCDAGFEFHFISKGHRSANSSTGDLYFESPFFISLAPAGWMFSELDVETCSDVPGLRNPSWRLQSSDFQIDQCLFKCRKATIFSSST